MDLIGGIEVNNYLEHENVQFILEDVDLAQ